MKINILTSMFPKKFPKKLAVELNQLIQKRDSFVFIASEFVQNHEKTEGYYSFFYNLFHECGIDFIHSYLVDSRMEKSMAHQLIASADVVWLSGGDTLAEYEYLKDYAIVEVLRKRSGITIGMSAGAINMAETAICTLNCGHDEQKIYHGLGMVDISVEPHFQVEPISEELLELSEKYPIYGLCDDAAIIDSDCGRTLLGDIYLIKNRTVTRISKNTEQ